MPAPALANWHAARALIGEASRRAVSVFRFGDSTNGNRLWESGSVFYPRVGCGVRLALLKRFGATGWGFIPGERSITALTEGAAPVVSGTGNSGNWQVVDTTNAGQPHLTLCGSLSASSFAVEHFGVGSTHAVNAGLRYVYDHDQLAAYQSAWNAKLSSGGHDHLRYWGSALGDFGCDTFRLYWCSPSMGAAAGTYNVYGYDGAGSPTTIGNYDTTSPVATVATVGTASTTDGHNDVFHTSWAARAGYKHGFLVRAADYATPGPTRGLQVCGFSGDNPGKPGIKFGGLNLIFGGEKAAEAAQTAQAQLQNLVFANEAVDVAMFGFGLNDLETGSVPPGTSPASVVNSIETVIGRLLAARPSAVPIIEAPPRGSMTAERAALLAQYAEALWDTLARPNGYPFIDYAQLIPDAVAAPALWDGVHPTNNCWLEFERAWHLAMAPDPSGARTARRAGAGAA